MKFLCVSLCIAAALAACATGPAPYAPVHSAGGLGYSSQQIQQDRFFVSFTGHSVEEAQRYALLRAAEITLAQGYQNFQIISKQTHSNTQRRSPVTTSIGIGIGNGGGYRYHGGSHTNVGIGIGINDLTQAFNGDKVTMSGEILLSNGPRTGATNIYDATSVAQSIGPTAFTN